jgi:dTDP-4-dehydrorhamnose 3,5-epimerase
VELSARNRRSLLVPAGVAHGFQTLEDDTEVLYMMSDFYEPALSEGVRWNDPAFGIEWPIAELIVHPRDAAYPGFDAVRFNRRRQPRPTFAAAALRG